MITPHGESPRTPHASLLGSASLAFPALLGSASLLMLCSASLLGALPCSSRSQAARTGEPPTVSPPPHTALTPHAA